MLTETIWPFIVWEFGIFRKEKWKKGIAATAVREVEEECGLSHLTLHHPLMRTWHGYVHKGRLIVKTTHWFFLTTHYSGELKPQIEEDIQLVQWMPSDHFRSAMAQSYPAIRLLVDAFFDQ